VKYCQITSTKIIFGRPRYGKKGNIKLGYVYIVGVFDSTGKILYI